MFDTVVIEGLKIPKLPKEVNDLFKEANIQFPNDFQTKDLSNTLTTYTIKETGQIYETQYKPTGKKIPFRSPFEGWVDNRSFLERVYHKLRHHSLNRKFPELKYTDERKPVNVKSKLTETFDISFYTEVLSRYVDVTLEVKAVDGKVQKISLKDSSIESLKDSKERIQRQKQFEANLAQSLAKNKEFKSKWYYPIIKETYNPFVFFATKLAQALCNYILKLTYRWRGV